jgi:hypothetical protein
MCEPWQLTRAQLVPFAATYPVSHLQDDGPASYSEADLHAYSLWRRRNEDVPPAVPVFPLGTWAVDRFESLWQLRAYLLSDPLLVFPEGDPYGGRTGYPPQQYPWLVDKYVSWLLAGSSPPPLHAIEMEGGRLKITQGHHRAAALVRVGREESPIWVSVAYRKPSGFLTDLTHAIAVELAVREGRNVPPAVLADYPHLCTSAALGADGESPHKGISL